MFEHARLRVGTIEQGNLPGRRALADQCARFINDIVRLIEIGKAGKDADRLARSGIGPQILAQTRLIVLDQRIGGVENIAERTIILFQANHVLDPELALEGAHIAHLRATESINALIVIAYRKQAGARRRRIDARQQFQPSVLQGVGILKLIDQNMAKTRLIMPAQRLVTRQQLVAAQQQLGEIGHALALALCLIFRVQLDTPLRVIIVPLGLRRADALFLVGIDEIGQLARREFFVIDAEIFEQAFDRRELIGHVENRERGRQRRLTMMQAQHAVAQPVKSADPQAARHTELQRQHRRQTRQHLFGRLVGECYGQHGMRACLPRRNQPGDARRQYARLAAAGAGQNQRMLRRQGHRGDLLGVELGKQIRHGRISGKTGPDYTGR